MRVTAIHMHPKENNMTTQTFTLQPIGSVEADTTGFTLKIDEAYREGLLGLDQFSHVIVFWWGDQSDTEQARATLTEKLYYADDIEAGVFACRTPNRPNPVLMTVCAILHIDAVAGTIVVPYLDAEDGTPIIDLKPYIGMSDRVKTLTPSSWFQGWPQWIAEKEGDMPDWVMAKLMNIPDA
ncbi:MAG: tRNA (N6-threonylcarbamoyladenosine(37)-N6)-methyltransferase TrmO [Anaerolineaceae bacterium]|nr:tRNA (N6-threonylcarbamoyladenosine(37)-N6)-methyltransferase TrmO [Anaerolineaceae bacterium]